MISQRQIDPLRRLEAATMSAPQMRPAANRAEGQLRRQQLTANSAAVRHNLDKQAAMQMDGQMGAQMNPMMAPQTMQNMMVPPETAEQYGQRMWQPRPSGYQSPYDIMARIGQRSNGPMFGPMQMGQTQMRPRTMAPVPMPYPPAPQQGPPQSGGPQQNPGMPYSRPIQPNAGQPAGGYFRQGYLSLPNRFAGYVRPQGSPDPTMQGSVPGALSQYSNPFTAQRDYDDAQMRMIQGQSAW